MAHEVELRQGTFADLDSVGFAIMYVDDQGAVPQVGLGAVDFATDEETTLEVEPGRPFSIAGQVWRVAEVHRGERDKWVALLQRVDALGGD